MGDTKNVFSEIEKISENKPNILDAKGIVIATFTSFVDIKEITAWFTLNDRNFLVFDLDKEYSGFHISKQEISDGLFGFLEKSNDKELDEKTLDLLKEMVIPRKEYSTFSSDTKTVEVKEEVTTLNESDIVKMTRIEKDNLIDEMIEFGVEKLSEKDKKILTLLTK